MQTESQTVEKYHGDAAAIVPFDMRRTDQIQTLNSFRGMADFFRELAETAFAAGMVPAGIRNVEGALTAIWRGAEVGLLPQQSLQSIYIVNGMPNLYGDAPKAIVESSGLMEDCQEFEAGTFPEDTFKAVCVVKRRGHSKERRSEFSIGDAKTARLWAKMSERGVPSAWVLYPRRMLMWRARGYALRDEFSDVLRGFPIRELMDEEDALFAAARPARVVEPVEPNLPKPEEAAGAEPPRSRPRGRPARVQVPPETKIEEPKGASGAPESAPEATAVEPKAEMAQVAPEPPKAAPKAAETEAPHVKPPGPFDFTKSAPKPAAPIGPHQQAAARLAEAGFSHKDFIFLLAYAGLLGPKVGEPEIESGALKFEELPEKAVKEALADWADVLKALMQKPWKRAHDQ